MNGREHSLGLAGSRCLAIEGGNIDRHGGEPSQPHPGTQCHRCGCSLPGLTGFTADRCGGTGRAHHDKPAWRRAAPLYRLISNLQPLPANASFTGRIAYSTDQYDRRSATPKTARPFSPLRQNPLAKHERLFEDGETKRYRTLVMKSCRNQSFVRLMTQHSR